MSVTKLLSQISIRSEFEIEVRGKGMQPLTLRGSTKESIMLCQGGKGCRRRGGSTMELLELWWGGD